MQLKKYIIEHKLWFIIAGVTLLIFVGVMSFFGQKSSLFQGALFRLDNNDGAKPLILLDTNETRDANFGEVLDLAINDGVGEELIEDVEVFRGPANILDPADVHNEGEVKPIIIGQPDENLNPAFTLGRTNDLDELANNQGPRQVTLFEDPDENADIEVLFDDNSDQVEIFDTAEGGSILDDAPPADEPEQANGDDDSEGQAMAFAETTATPPFATNLQVIGDELFVGALVAAYEYNDAEDNPEGDSQIEWYKVVPKASFSDSIEVLWRSFMFDEDPDAQISFSDVESFFETSPVLLESQSDTLEIDSSEELFIYFRYQPVSTEDPTDGRFYYSELVKLEKVEVAANTDDEQPDEQIVEPEATEIIAEEPIIPEDPIATQGPIIIGDSAVPNTPTDSIVIGSANIPVQTTTPAPATTNTSFNLNSNTSANIIQSGQVQGNTGPEALAVIPLLFSISYLGGRRFARKGK